MFVSKRNLRKSIIWSYSMKWGTEGINFIVLFILASILGPRNFGIVTIAMIYISFIRLLLDQGMSLALVQRKDLNIEHLNSAFWMILFISFIMAGIGISLRSWWASVNKLPELAQIILALSVIIPIQGLTVVQQAVLRRNMDFKSLAIRSNISELFGGVIGIVMALMDYGVWSLVGKQVCSAFASLMLLWALSDWRPRFRFSFIYLKDLLGFSFGAFLIEFGTFAGNNIDGMLVGIFFGPTAVGLYRLAYRLTNMLFEMITRPVQWITLPHISPFQDERDKLIDSFLKIVKLSSAVIFPAMVSLAILSEQVLKVVGQEWVLAANALKILCIYGMLQTVSMLIAQLLLAVSKPYVVAVMEWMFLVFSCCMYVIVGILLQDATVKQQLIGIAASRTIIFIMIYTTASIIIAIRVMNIRIYKFAMTIVPSIFAAITTLLAVNMVKWISNPILVNPYLILLLNIAVAISSGVGSIMLFIPEIREEIYRIFYKVI